MPPGEDGAESSSDADREFTQPVSLVGVSLTDVVASGSDVLTNDPFPVVIWEDARPTASIFSTAFKPAYSVFNYVLAALYSAPQSVRSKLTLTPWLKTVSHDLLSFDSFHKLRRMNVGDKSGAPMILPGVMAGVADREQRGKRCLLFQVRSVRTAVEAHLQRLSARGAMSSIGDEEPVVLLICGDGAGRRINGFKLWMLAVIPLQCERTGSLEAVLPLAMAFGSFLDDSRCTLQLIMGEILASLTHVTLAAGASGPARTHTVQLRNVSDLADATAQYRKEDVARPSTVSFVLKGRPLTFFTKHPCPSCLQPAAEYCTVPNSPPRSRPFPPCWRGFELPLWHRYGRLHAMIHGLPVMLSEMAILLFRAGQTRIARWICSAFPRTSGFEPLAAIYAGEAVPAGSPSAQRAAAAAGRGDAWRCAGDRPPHMCRAKDAKTFIDGTRSSIVVRERLSEAPPADFSASALDVIDLLSMATVPTSFTSGRERCPAVELNLAAIFEKAHRFFRGILHPTQGTLGSEAARAVWRALGDDSFESLKRICALNAPFDVARDVPADAPFLRAATPEDRSRMMVQLERVPFQYSAVSLGPAAHVAYQHAVDIFDELPFSSAAKATEEAFDHFFSYLYVTVPSIEPRSVSGSWSQDAARVWMCVLEATQVCVPVGSRSREVFNSAYGAEPR